MYAIRSYYGAHRRAGLIGYGGNIRCKDAPVDLNSFGFAKEFNFCRVFHLYNCCGVEPRQFTIPKRLLATQQL